MSNKKQGIFMPGYMLNSEVNPQADSVINDMIPVYQDAFKKEPWNEVSKCVSTRLDMPRCISGLSSTPVGNECEDCGLCPQEEAYPKAELSEKFKAVADMDSVIYQERQVGGRLTMAAIAYRATAYVIADQKYADVPEMAKWLVDELGGGSFVWLDEVFSNRSIKPAGNLSEFTCMISGLASVLNMPTSKVAFRTISPAMLAAAERFKTRTTIYRRQEQVPDRREFVVIDLKKES